MANELHMENLTTLSSLDVAITILNEADEQKILYMSNSTIGLKSVFEIILVVVVFIIYLYCIIITIHLI